jgi:hypothetical protein
VKLFTGRSLGLPFKVKERVRLIQPRPHSKRPTSRHTKKTNFVPWLNIDNPPTMSFTT